MTDGSFYCYVPKSPAVPGWLLDNVLSRSKSEKLVLKKLDELLAQSDGGALDSPSPSLESPGAVISNRGSLDGQLSPGGPLSGSVPQSQTYVLPGGGLTVKHGSFDAETELWRRQPCLYSSEQLVNPNKQAVIVFYGYLSNLGELIRAVEGSLDPRLVESFETPTRAQDSSPGARSAAIGSLTAALVLSLYLDAKEGEEIILLSELQGQYAFVVYDSSKRKIFAARDASGKEPLWYREEEHGAISLTNNPIEGADVDAKWEELPPGHFVSGKQHKVQQFALTPQQLYVRELQEAFDDNLSINSEDTCMTAGRRLSQTFGTARSLNHRKSTDLDMFSLDI